MPALPRAHPPGPKRCRSICVWIVFQLAQGSAGFSRLSGGVRPQNRGSNDLCCDGGAPEGPCSVCRVKTSVALSSTSQGSVASLSSARRIQHRSYHDNEAWLRGWSSVRTNNDDDCYEIWDALSNSPKADFPKDLCGTFYQNGPGLFEIGEEPIVHPFDADGLVRAISFSNGAAWVRHRLVETPQRRKERDAQRVLYRGVFGTAKNRGAWWSNVLDMRSKNVANTHVLFHQNRLYALWDAGRPIELDPITLRTRGESWNFGQRYAAHYKVDPHRGTLCNFAIYFGFPDPAKSHRLDIMEHDLHHGQLLYRQSYTLPGLAIGHDMAVTDHWMVFFRSPCKFDPWSFLLGRKGPAQCFEWDENSDSSQIHLIPRELGKGANHRSGAPISLDIPPCFSFHVCNAFESAAASRPMVVVDVVLADRMFMATTDSSPYPERSILDTLNWSELPGYRLVRFEIDVRNVQVVSQKTLSVTDDPANHTGGGSSAASTVDFPAVHPQCVGREYRYAYLSASSDPTRTGPLQGLIKVDVQRGYVVEKWLPEPHEFLSEVVVVPRSTARAGEGIHLEEDDAYLLGYVFDGRDNATDVVVFDATCVSKGPISRARLRSPLPHPLHGTFVPGYAPPCPCPRASPSMT